MPCAELASRLHSGSPLGHPQGVPCAKLSPQVTEGYFRKTSHIKQKIPQEIPPPASLVPLVLSGPLCPAGISPPRGESPLKGRLFYIQAPSFILGSPLGHPQGVPCAELSPQVTEGYFRET